MRDDIDTNVVFWSKETADIFNMLHTCLRNKSDADNEESGFCDLWEDHMDHLAGMIEVNTSLSSHSIFQELAERMNQAIESSSERYRKLYRSGIDECLSSQLVSLAYSQVPRTIDTRLLESISGIVQSVTRIHAFEDYQFEFYIEVFGSSVSQLCTSESDVDLLLQGDLVPLWSGGGRKPLDTLSREDSMCILESLSVHISRKGGFTVQRIPANYPLLKICDPRTRRTCELCFPLGGGIDPRKDQVLFALNLVDERFRLLFTLAKLWAENFNLLNASLGRLNSYTLAQLVIFHLQNRPVPILPRLKKILPGEKFGVFKTGCRFTHENEEIAAVSAAHRLRCYANRYLLSSGTDDYGNNTVGYRNHETMASLFNSFMVLMVGVFEGWNSNDNLGSVRSGSSEPVPISNLMRYLRISTYYGCMYFGESPEEDMENCILHPKHFNEAGVIHVEDPFDKNQNTARVLSRKCSRGIAMAARSALNSFQFESESIDDYLFKVFGYTKQCQ